MRPRFPVAVLLDRDGTLNVDTHYPYRLDDLSLLPGTLEALAELAALPVHLIVVSNQAGLALGIYSLEEMSAFNRELRLEVERAGGRIDAFYFCPHLEPKNLSSGMTPCSCSKPAPGLLIEAAEDFHFDLGRSAFVGDKPSDVAAGRAAGTRTIYVGSDARSTYPVPDHAVGDLRSVVPIVQEMLGRDVVVALRKTSA